MVRHAVDNFGRLLWRRLAFVELFAHKQRHEVVHGFGGRGTLALCLDVHAHETCVPVCLTDKLYDRLALDFFQGFGHKLGQTFAVLGRCNGAEKGFPHGFFGCHAAEPFSRACGRKSAARDNEVGELVGMLSALVQCACVDDCAPHFVFAPVIVAF